MCILAIRLLFLAKKSKPGQAAMGHRVTVLVAITSDFSYAIHFPVVAYPENGIFGIKSFVFCGKILYSHSELPYPVVAFEVLHREHGKGVLGSVCPKPGFEGN